MTLDTCRKRLEIAKKHGNQQEIRAWEARILKKTPRQEVVSDGKKPKR